MTNSPLSPFKDCEFHIFPSTSGSSKSGIIRSNSQTGVSKLTTSPTPKQNLYRLHSTENLTISTNIYKNYPSADLSSACERYKNTAKAMQVQIQKPARQLVELAFFYGWSKKL
jgi:hypothetical protein